MRVERSYLNWGVFLIAVGAVPLAIRAGLVPAGVRWWDLWPLLLVGWGVGLILGRTQLGLLGGVLVAATIGLIVGGALSTAGSIGGFAAGCGSGTGTPFTPRTGTFTADRVEVDLDRGCGTLDVSAGGTGWQVAGASSDGSGPDIVAAADALRVRSNGAGFNPFDSNAGAAWQVRLPANQTIDLSVSANAGTSHLALANSTLGRATLTANAGSTRADFTGAAIGSLTVTANAGDARLTLPAASLTGRLAANAGSIAICLPAGTGLRVSMSGSLLGGNNFEERGLVQDGDTWTTSDYGTAATKIDLSATANAGSITLNPDGGCR